MEQVQLRRAARPSTMFHGAGEGPKDAQDQTAASDAKTRRCAVFTL